VASAPCAQIDVSNASATAAAGDAVVIDVRPDEEVASTGEKRVRFCACVCLLVCCLLSRAIPLSVILANMRASMTSLSLFNRHAVLLSIPLLLSLLQASADVA
jgi:hypothetical protein